MQDDIYKGNSQAGITATQNLYDPFDSINGSNWTLTSPIGAITSERKDGDTALKLSTTEAGWHQKVNRSVASIGNDLSFLAQFKVSGSQVQSKIGLETSGRWGYADFRQWALLFTKDGSGNYVTQLQAVVNQTNSYATVLPTGAFQPDRWYVVMLTADPNAFTVRIWERDNPAVSGFYKCALPECDINNFKDRNYNFAVVNYNGTTWLDEYSEGTIATLNQTGYASVNTATVVPPKKPCPPPYGNPPLYSGPGDSTCVHPSYLDFSITWTHPTENKSFSFEGSGEYLAQRRGYSYTMGTFETVQVVTLNREVESIWDGSNWADFRETRTNFYPHVGVVTKGIEEYNLVGLPGNIDINKCSTGSLNGNCTNPSLMASEWNLYDQVYSYNVPPVHGKLTAKRTFLGFAGPGNTNPRFHDVSFGYDSWGNKTSVVDYTVEGIGNSFSTGGAQTTTIDYENTYHTYPYQSHNSLLHLTSWQYDYTLGLLKQETDSNGAITEADYDTFGRLTKLIRPGDTLENPTLWFTPNDANRPFVIAAGQKASDANAYQQSWKYYNGLGQLIQEQTNGSAGSVVDTWEWFESSGHYLKQTVPYQVSGTLNGSRNSSQPATVTRYDILGRPTRVTHPDGTYKTYSYAIVSSGGAGFGLVLQITETDERGYATNTWQDERGLIRRVIPPAPTGPTVDYAYDELDRLVSVSHPNTSGLVTTIQYDSAGRKIGMNDPDMGVWSYAYDAVGNLTSQTDARNQTICLYYDSLNRLVGKMYQGSTSCPGNPTYNVSYFYDQSTVTLSGGDETITNPIGRRTSMDDEAGLAAWKYDPRGRVTESIRTLDNFTEVYRVSFAYNPADQVTQTTYPDGEVVTTTYDTNKLLPISLSTNLGGGTSYYVGGPGSFATHDAQNRLTDLPYGNGLHAQYGFYPDNQQGGRLHTLQVGSLLSLSYTTYDQTGNLWALTDNSASIGGQSLSYTYDSLNRLDRASASGGLIAGYSHDYDYDSAGRLSSKIIDGITINNTYDAHALVSTSDGGAFGYDANGNMTSRKDNQYDVTYTQIWDEENRLKQILWPEADPTHKTTYIYDGNGNKLLQIEWTLTPPSTVQERTTIYIEGIYEEEKTTAGLTEQYARIENGLNLANINTLDGKGNGFASLIPISSVENSPDHENSQAGIFSETQNNRSLANVSFRQLWEDQKLLRFDLQVTFDILKTIAIGDYYTCAITSAGGVKCWGRNDNGQLGDGSTTQRLTPTDVSGLTSGIVTVTAGEDHTCALTSSGGVKCWGYNRYGQIGDGTSTRRLAPVYVSGLSTGVVAISAGQSHVCALTSTGGVKCWGRNSDGQLGDGSRTDRSTPVDVSGLTSGVVAISSGDYHTCALTTSGGVKCWGNNSSSQLGDGTTTRRTTPVNVTNLSSGVASIAGGGSFSCALTTLGGQKCWGGNSSGQLGDGTTTNRSTPVDVNGLTTGVTAITAGASHACALTTAGGMKCWGANTYGRLGDGTTTQRLTPADVFVLSEYVVAIRAGDYHTCALLTNGTLKCWGRNDYGQVGIGVTPSENFPVSVPSFQGPGDNEPPIASAAINPPAGTLTNQPVMATVTATDTGGGGVAHIYCKLETDTGWTDGGIESCSRTAANNTIFHYYAVDGAGNASTEQTVLIINIASTRVAVGRQHTCAIDDAGGVKCWGSNTQGQLGDGTKEDRWAPTEVSGLSSGIVALAAGEYHTCALTAGGAVKCWGDGYLSPYNVTGLSSGVTRITAGSKNTCALTSAGVKCWGYNRDGELGDGTTVDKSNPVSVIGLGSGVLDINSGYWHTCALLETGAVKCWGYNADGEIGDGTTSNKLEPVDASGLTSGVKAIAAGEYHTCALMGNDTVKCWGRNSEGQLGDGTTTQRLFPTDIPGLSNIFALSAGNAFTCALRDAGAVVCWGANSNGQLGDGTLVQRLSPANALGIDHGVVSIYAGGYHTCAFMESGGLKCWGYNWDSQLGNGIRAEWSSPIDVMGLSTGQVAVSAGSYHTCVVTSTAGVKCWGPNWYGQLGDGTTNNHLTPVDVYGLTSGAVAVVLGTYHTCSLTDSGGVLCWGANWLGQLGNGSTTRQLTPISVNGLSQGVSAITAGTNHTCALTTGGAVKCWGANSKGQLGDGTTLDRSTPVDVSGLSSGVVAITAGSDNTCALTQSGNVKCWGSNEDGKLGDGTRTDSSIPVAVLGLPGNIQAVSAGGNHVCALTENAGIMCWGRNWDGELGVAAGSPHLTPGYVTGLTSGVSAISSGTWFTCALTMSGGIKCWGANWDGEIGNGTTATPQVLPVDVLGLSSGVISVSAGYTHTCAVVSGGGIKCWGTDRNGQLGTGNRLFEYFPVNVLSFPDALDPEAPVVDVETSTLPDPIRNHTVVATATVTDSGGSGLAHVFCKLDEEESWTDGGTQTCARHALGNTLFRSFAVDGVGNPSNEQVITISGIHLNRDVFKSIGAGASHTCTITDGGGVKCWGYNTDGQLGNGTNIQSLIPVDVVGLSSGVVALAVGEYHTCALTDAGGVKCWGFGGNGRLGYGGTQSQFTPVDVSGLTQGVIAIAAGAWHTCALTGEGAVRCWGTGGVLGDGTTTWHLTPVSVIGLDSGVVKITAGFFHNCALMADGAVKCWGSNTYGQIGDGTQTDRLVPVDITALGTGNQVISAGAYHTCVITSAGVIKCWGRNPDGRLGDGTTNQQLLPVNVSGMNERAVYVSGGSYHTCAITESGYVKCWGENTSGQLGDGSTTRRLTPVRVNGITRGVIGLAAGTAHSCNLTEDGGIKCWGNNSNGQLGNNGTTNQSTPVVVVSFEGSPEPDVNIITKYYKFQGQIVAVRKNDQLYYLTGDSLGSISLVTDANQNVVAAPRYLPFGEERGTSGTNISELGFTGQRNKTAFGLIDYNARFYDPYLNRWIQPDTIIPDPDNPLDWDRYGYVRNNPINNTDPSGHRVVRDCNTVDCTGYNPIQSYNIVSNNLYRSPLAWNQLPSGYQSALQHQGVTEEAYSESEWAGTHGVRDAYVYEDPATLLSLGGGAALRAGIMQLVRTVIGVETADCVTDGQCLVTQTANNLISISKEGKLDKIADDILDWVGQGERGKIIINKAGDIIVRNLENTRKFRIDLLDPSPHEFPHMHLEWLNEAGEWISQRIWPFDVPRP